jgi:hypothetical protein
MNGYDETLLAMGAALRDAVREPDRADEAGVILAGLADRPGAYRGAESAGLKARRRELGHGRGFEECP